MQFRLNLTVVEESHAPMLTAAIDWKVQQAAQACEDLDSVVKMSDSVVCVLHSTGMQIGRGHE